MSQITRCPACATMFRVADAQLAAAQGWVRCGQCAEVFEAGLHWVADGPVVLAAADPAGAEPAQAGLAASPVQAASLARVTETLAPTDDALWTGPPAASRPEASAAAPWPQAPAESLEFPEISQAHEQAQDEEVSFVQTARRRALWQSAPVRAALGLSCLALLAALLLQWVLHEKDPLAAQAPRLAPVLQALCRPLGCQIRPFRRIESLVIENASFSRSAPNAYRLSFVFRNMGDAAIEMPALEVTLTDRQQQALVRRVLLPAQFGATADTLSAHGEQAGTLALKITGAEAAAASPASQAGQLPVAGYRILAFYP